MDDYFGGSVVYWAQPVNRVFQFAGTALHYGEAMEMACDFSAQQRIFAAYQKEPICRYCGRKNDLMGNHACAGCGAPLY
jgi:hypothetical protein